MRDIAVWFMAIFTIILSYNYKKELTNFGNRVLVELTPGKAVVSKTNQTYKIIIKKRNDGHFYLRTRLNGKDVDFLVDTGASDIVLSNGDAVSAGIDLTKLRANKIYNTANGQVLGAEVVIRHFAIDQFVLTNVTASVTSGKMNKSLLGMSFLTRAESYMFSGDNLIIEFKL